MAGSTLIPVRPGDAVDDDGNLVCCCDGEKCRYEAFLRGLVVIGRDRENAVGAERSSTSSASSITSAVL